MRNKPRPLRTRSSKARQAAASCKPRSARNRPASAEVPTRPLRRKTFTKFANYLCPSNSRHSNHLPSCPLSPPLPSDCPPDTMWLREGFARAISPRGKGFRTHLSGSPLVNSFGFNKALRISRTCMSGMGSLRKKSPKNPRLDRHGLGRPPAGLRRHRQQMLRRSGAVPEADEGGALGGLCHFRRHGWPARPCQFRLPTDPFTASHARLLEAMGDSQGKRNDTR